jgi:hypothetical protein
MPSFGVAAPYGRYGSCTSKMSVPALMSAATFVQAPVPAALPAGRAPAGFQPMSWPTA